MVHDSQQILVRDKEKGRKQIPLLFSLLSQEPRPKSKKVPTKQLVCHSCNRKYFVDNQQIYHFFVPIDYPPIIWYDLSRNGSAESFGRGIMLVVSRYMFLFLSCNSSFVHSQNFPAHLLFLYLAVVKKWDCTKTDIHYQSFTSILLHLVLKSPHPPTLWPVLFQVKIQEKFQEIVNVNHSRKSFRKRFGWFVSMRNYLFNI